MSIIQLKVTREDWLEKLKNYNEGTWRTYQSAIKQWDSFLESIHLTDEETLLELRAHQADADTYTFLNKFIGYLVKQQVKRSTMDLCFAALRSWCAENGVMLFNEYIKRFVKFPKPVIETRVPLTPQKISMLVNSSSGLMRPTLLILLSSGMRISEVLQLEWGDIDFENDPVRIRVRADTTKTKTQRLAFMSAEAVRELLAQQTIGEPDQLIFVNKVSHSNLIVFENKFARLRKNIGLTDKYNDEKNYHVNVHAFRSYFHTQATKVLGGDIAHALIGHKQYLDQYLRLDDSEKGKLYKKLEPYITCNVRNPQKP